MFSTLKNLRGNVRACVYTEPIWGIPFNLYAPYVSVYMLALGLTDGQIGLVTSIGLVFQIGWALVSGAITDKLGRKRTTLITDLISWTVPCFIWAISRNFNYFLVAAIFNSLWRISMNSWNCLLVEDTDPALLVPVYSWIYISGLVAAFIAPFGGLLISRFTLVSTVRALFVLAFFMMTAKFLIMNQLVSETNQGRVRMQETRGKSVFAVLLESRDVLGQILHAPVILLTIGLMVFVSISQTIRGTFWSILVVEKLQVPASSLALFFSGRSIVMLLVYFLVMPRLRRVDVRKTIVWGFLGLVVSQIILVLTPPGNFALLALSTLIEAATFPLASTLLDTLVVVVVDPKERARIMALVYVMVILFTSPFGWIAGEISQIDRLWPFVLNIVLFAGAAGLAWVLSRRAQGETVGGEPREGAAAA